MAMADLGGQGPTVVLAECTGQERLPPGFGGQIHLAAAKRQKEDDGGDLPNELAR